MESPLEPRPIYIIGLSSTHSTCMDIVHWKVKCEKHENLVKKNCVIWQQICARPACNPITFPFLKRTILKYGSLCESRVRWNFQGGFWGGAAWCIFVCMQFFPIPDSWGDAGVPDNQTQKRRRFICVKGKSTTKYYHVNTFSKECFSLLHILKSHLMRGLVK